MWPRFVLDGGSWAAMTTGLERGGGFPPFGVMEIRIEIASALIGPRNDKCVGRNDKYGRFQPIFFRLSSIVYRLIPIFLARSCIFALVLRPDSPIPLGLKQGNSGINM